MRSATALALCLGVHGSLSAATFTVATSADAGPGSLREAILEANDHPGPDTIAFAIGDPGSQHVIEPASALPGISDPVLLDGDRRVLGADLPTSGQVLKERVFRLAALVARLRGSVTMSRRSKTSWVRQ